MTDPVTTGPVTTLGQVDVQAFPPGETITGTFSMSYSFPTIHELPQPVFGAMSVLNPTLQFGFATDQTWQAQLGWTLVKRQWSVLGQRLDVSLQQSVARQFGPTAAETMWVANLLQGQLQSQPSRAGVYVYLQGGFFGRRTDERAWSAGFQGTLGLGWQFDIAVPRRR
jgi:hypothetical protein